MMELGASSADRGLRQRKTLTTVVLQSGFALRFAPERSKRKFRLKGRL